MASQVLSGASNPNYTNNTGQNVRIVINYMEGTALVPTRFGPSPSGFGGPIVIAPLVPSRITINWAGVSASSSSELGNITIGRNLAYSMLTRDTISGGTRFIQVRAATGRFGESLGFPVAGSGSLQEIAVDADIALATNANNASGFSVALPTELILAPGQTFSAVCGVHNIVVIPEAG